MKISKSTYHFYGQKYLFYTLGIMISSLVGISCGDNEANNTEMSMNEIDESSEIENPNNDETNNSNNNEGGIEGSEEPEQTQNYQIEFAAKVGEQDFQCGVTVNELGTLNTSLSFNDLRFYVHNVVLITQDGQEDSLILDEDQIWQRDGVALLDFEDGCENGTTQLNTSIRGTAPAKQYTSIRFTVGVPTALNSSDVILEGRGSPLNQSAMFWVWKTGYKYLRLDTDSPFFRFHLGASACDTQFQCDYYNLPTFELPDFDPSQSRIILDLKTLLQSSDLSQNTEGTAPGCMAERDDPDCISIFKHLTLIDDSAPIAFRVAN